MASGLSAPIRADARGDPGLSKVVDRRYLADFSAFVSALLMRRDGTGTVHAATPSGSWVTGRRTRGSRRTSRNVPAKAPTLKRSGSRLIASPAGSSGPVDPDEGEHRALLKATVKATPRTPVDRAPQSTIWAAPLEYRTTLDGHPRTCWIVNSSAMSTDGSFPSRPRQS
jgi:hypothetical protein